MTLKDICEKPLADILKEMDMVDVKIHNDDYGKICSIEVKYAPQEKQEQPVQRKGWFE